MTDPEMLDRSAWPSTERHAKKPEFAEFAEGGPYTRVSDGSEIPPTVVTQVPLSAQALSAMRVDLLLQATRYAQMSGETATVKFGDGSEYMETVIRPPDRGPTVFALAMVFLTLVSVGWMAFGALSMVLTGGETPRFDGFGLVNLFLLAMFVGVSACLMHRHRHR